MDKEKFLAQLKVLHCGLYRADVNGKIQEIMIIRKGKDHLIIRFESGEERRVDHKARYFGDIRPIRSKENTKKRKR